LGSQALSQANAQDSPHPTSLTPDTKQINLTVDGADQMRANPVEVDGANHVGANRVASKGADHVGANRVAEDGADRVGGSHIASTSTRGRIGGIGSDAVASRR
jgi:ribose 5-phosphate isomerase